MAGIEDRKPKNENQEVVILKDDDDEIIILDDLEKQSQPSQPIDQPQETQANLSKKIIILGGISGFTFLLFAVILFLVFSTKKDPAQPVISEPQEVVEPQRQITPAYKYNTTKIDDLITKANSLYQNGNAKEALKIYESIAVYNESMSNYNLGVSQMNQGKFDEALESFKKAINNKENADVSALNAAVCALNLNNKNLFEYYIGVAYAFLTPNSSAYKYYGALINYYKGYYQEALKILQTMQGDEFFSEARYLEAKIQTLLYKDDEALKSLKEVRNFNANLPLGLLYARSGDYQNAKKHLLSIDASNPNYNKARLANAFIDLKISNFGSAAAALKQINDENSEFISQTYPLKVALKDDFFNIQIAQERFSRDILFGEQTSYEMIFYFTPYEVFDAKQSMEYIKKGSISTFISNQATNAQNYLKTGQVVSKVNARLSEIIQMALDNDLKPAIDEFEKLVQLYEGHSILHHDLALAYAKFGDFANAYKHFIKSYHLNSKNYLGGVYAIICAKIIGRDYDKLLGEVTESINDDTSLGENNLYSAMLFLFRNNSGALNRWLDEDESDDVLNLAFDVIVASKLKRDDILDKKTKRLKDKLGDDILANILFFVQEFDTDVKKFASTVQYHFFNDKADKRALYGGASILKQQFVKILQISGLVSIQREFILNDLKQAPQSPKIREALAYLDLFTGDYQEAYEIYNDLVYNYKINDANTLFYAAVASIGSSHPDNAIAYLELGKLTNPRAPEIRMALGLLYQEVGNIPAAAAQYSSLGNIEFSSQFFTFNLRR